MASLIAGRSDGQITSRRRHESGQSIASFLQLCETECSAKVDFLLQITEANRVNVTWNDHAISSEKLLIHAHVSSTSNPRFEGRPMGG